MAPTIITLTTDFGRVDTYVAQMKGVILTVNPAVQLVDVTHDIPAQHTRRASTALNEVIDAFPAETIHVVVVDPGVGSTRRILAVESFGQRFIAPDNGVLTDVLKRATPKCVIAIDSRNVQDAMSRISDKPTQASTTFHGRDIMAPVAAFWSIGQDPVDFGTPIVDSLIQLPELTIVRGSDRIEGEIVWTDAFGNAVTNLTGDLLTEWPARQICVQVGSHRIVGVRQFYEEEPVGTPLALIGSSGYLEIAVNRGHAASFLGLRIGDAVCITCAESD